MFRQTIHTDGTEIKMKAEGISFQKESDNLFIEEPQQVTTIISKHYDLVRDVPFWQILRDEFEYSRTPEIPRYLKLEVVKIEDTYNRAIYHLHSMISDDEYVLVIDKNNRSWVYTLSKEGLEYKLKYTIRNRGIRQYKQLNNKLK